MRVGGKSVVPSAPKLRQIFTLLAIRANTVVTVSEIVEEVWTGVPPKSLSTTLQTYILQLRKILREARSEAVGAGRESNGVEGFIVTYDGGYLFSAPQSMRKDFEEFTGSVETGHQYMRNGKNAEAAELLGEALALWRGNVLVDVRRGSVLDAYAVKLEEVRLSAQILRLDACLGQGADLHLIPELNALAALHPLNETLQYQRMIALYRAGQVAEALSSYRTFYSEVMEQVGIEPSTHLRDLQSAILNSAPALSAVATSEEIRRCVSGDDADGGEGGEGHPGQQGAERGSGGDTRHSQGGEWPSVVRISAGGHLRRSRPPVQWRAKPKPTEAFLQSGTSSSWGVRRITLDGAGVPLSALISEPVGTPARAVVVAVHNSGTNADYFDGRAHPQLSLMTLGAALGYTVVAVDRPGYRLSAAQLPHGLGLMDQAAALRAALDDLSSRFATGSGCFLLGHSYGGNVALATAADHTPPLLLGLDISGCGHEYAVDPHEVSVLLDRGRSAKNWGPLNLYPPGTFRGARSRAEDMPARERAELASRPGLFRSVAPRVRVPVRLTFAEHDAWWRQDADTLADLAAQFVAAPRVTVDRQPDAGHNISLGWAARSYHLRALAFLESCLVPRETTHAERSAAVS
ncbi:alpha/beta fold hydrolase [Streptomyces sp. NBC_01451]|uniref:alpha/beta fold hydrolase n=1 Tax=Streptomyces sp. NBC_01451 TaxID=2903872 RepID=UPI002E34E473|nr:alpha/beta fold hydrolase [Streptomyces sp. NBC_01451]